MNNADKEQLVIAGKRDFDSALSSIDTLKESKARNDVYLKVAQEQAGAGLEPVYPPDYFLKIARRRISWKRNDVYEGITMLQANMGDIQTALQTAELTFQFPSFYIHLARVAAQQRFDPQPIFDRIHNRFRIDAGSTGDVRDAGLTLEAQRELGLDAPKYLIDRFRVRDRKRNDYSNSYNLELAEAYTRAGYPEDAMEVWLKARETGYHYPHKTAVLPYIALAQARNGLDPTPVVETAIRYADMLKTRVDKEQLPECLQAEIYAKLSKAYAVYGLDPSPFIERAFQKALEVKDFDNVVLTNIRAGVYRGIAKAQVSYGVDTRNALSLALEWADKVMEPGEELNDDYGVILQVLEWEDIFHVQLNGKLFEDARDTLRRFDRYPDQDIVVHKAKLLAELGSAQIEAA